MSFKIDTKDNYVLISPENSEINVNMAEALRQIIDTHKTTDTNNFIIDLANCSTFDVLSNTYWLDLHEYTYNELFGSLVFTNLTEEVNQKMKQERLHLSLNITPTLIEAKDIVNMEILERELLGE